MPVLAWLGRELGVQLQPTESIFGAELPAAELAAVRQYLYGELRCRRQYPPPLPAPPASAAGAGRAAHSRGGCSRPGPLGATPAPTTLAPCAHPHPPGLDAWELTAASQLAAACKSVTLGLAAARGGVGMAGTLRAARLEEDLQLESWGLVEGGHDLDVADLRARVAAPLLFARLLRA